MQVVAWQLNLGSFEVEGSRMYEEQLEQAFIIILYYKNYQLIHY